jgi:hypothetical protein
MVLGRYITYVPPVVNGIAYVDICEVEVVGKCWIEKKNRLVYLYHRID